MSLRSFVLSLTLRTHLRRRRELILSRLIAHTLPRQGQRNIIRVEPCHLVLLHYRGGWPVPRAASLSSGGLCIYTNIYINVGHTIPSFCLFVIFKHLNRKHFAIFVLLRIVDEHSYRQEFSLPVILDPGSRAHEVGLCKL
jgi:hypothetical protein